MLILLVKYVDSFENKILQYHENMLNPLWKLDLLYTPVDWAVDIFSMRYVVRLKTEAADGEAGYNDIF